MTIETRHSVEDTVWLIEDRKAVEAKISSIDICVTQSLAGGHFVDIKYSLYNKGFKFPESLLFKTKEALLQSL